MPLWLLPWLLWLLPWLWGFLPWLLWLLLWLWLLRLLFTDVGYGD